MFGTALGSSAFPIMQTSERSWDRRDFRLREVRNIRGIVDISDHAKFVTFLGSSKFPIGSRDVRKIPGIVDISDHAQFVVMTSRHLWKRRHFRLCDVRNIPGIVGSSERPWIRRDFRLHEVRNIPGIVDISNHAKFKPFLGSSTVPIMHSS